VTAAACRLRQPGKRISLFTDVSDRHGFAADPDPDLNFHFHADPDPDMNFHSHADPHADFTPSFTHVSHSNGSLQYFSFLTGGIGVMILSILDCIEIFWKKC
jgi:hypothetical protein